MSNVIIDKSKIDILANAISVKSGEPVTMTLDEMVSAVDGIEQGIFPTGNIDITSAGVTDVTNYATATVAEGEIYLAEPYVSFITENGVRKYVIMSSAEISSGDSHGKEGYIADATFVQDTTKGNAIATGTSVTPTESAQTIGGQKYMLEGAVTVNAIPSNYVGSGITQRSSSDLTASGATVTVPSGYYSSQQTKSVSSGTEGTPTASKGTVSNHSISVTPSVTNTAGYISGGTKNGTAVTVSASELVSGNLPITQNGNNIDCANYSTVSVNVASGSSKNAQVAQATTRASSSTYTSCVSLTCSVAGTYDVYWSCFRSSTSGTSGSQLYVKGSAYGTANTTFTNHIQNNHLTGVELAKNDTVAVYARSRGSNYYAYVGTLTIKQTS